MNNCTELVQNDARSSEFSDRDVLLSSSSFPFMNTSSNEGNQFADIVGQKVQVSCDQIQQNEDV